MPILFFEINSINNFQFRLANFDSSIDVENIGSVSGREYKNLKGVNQYSLDGKFLQQFASIKQITEFKNHCNNFSFRN